MEVKYSKHLELRLAFRKIDHDLPRTIYEYPDEKYVDHATGHFIAVKKVILYGKERDVKVCYDSICRRD